MPRMSRMPFVCGALCLFLAGSVARADLTGDELRSLCAELGVTPDASVVLGMDLNAITSALTRLEEEELRYTQLRDLQTQMNQLNAEIGTTRRRMRDASDETDLQALVASMGSLWDQSESVQASITAIRDQLRGVFLPASVDPALAELVCDTGTGLPAEYRVLDLDDEDAAELASALTTAERAEARGIALPNSVDQVISSRDAHPDVIAAKSRLQIWLVQVEQAFLARP